VSCAPRLSDLATQAKVRAEGLELFDVPRPFGVRFRLNLAHDIAELGGYDVTRDSNNMA
jgi:hypothetical protein